jgi:hypothetical protein
MHWENIWTNNSFCSLMGTPGHRTGLYAPVEQTVNYNVAQIEICLSNDHDREAKKSEEGELIFHKNALRALRLNVPAVDFQAPRQPKDPDEINLEFFQGKKAMIE